MAFQVAGKIIKIFDTEQKSETFQVRQFVIEVAEGQYPQMVSFQLTQDKCNLVDSYAEGDQINVHFDLRGREWNGKYFTNLNAWRIEATDESGGGSGGASQSGNQGSGHQGGGQAAYQSGQDSGGSSTSKTTEQPDFDDDIPF